jgi:hypothetical protein
MSMNNPLAMSLFTPKAMPSPIDVANNALKNHPEVAQKSPQIMADAIATNDPNQILNVSATHSIATHAQALQDHQDQYNSQGLWSRILGGPATVQRKMNIDTMGASDPVSVKNVMNWANKPLQEIQRDYKFLHSVYTDHSIWQGVLATLGVIGGAVLGTALGGPLGTFAGADAAMASERNLSKLIPNFKDSVAKSEDPNYLVSPGRDLSNGLSNIPGFGALANTKSGYGQTISGVADGVFDFTFDPLLKAGAINKGLKTGKYVGAAVDDAGKTLFDTAGQPIVKATLPIANQLNSVNNFMLSYAGKALNSSQVLDAFANPLQTAFRRAVGTIAETSNPIEIQRLFPRSQFTAYEAAKLAKATTPNEVVNEMGKTLYSSELVAQDAIPRTTLILPTQTVARSFVDKGLQAVRQNGVSLNEERNLLLPKTSSVTDEAGNVKINPDGSIQKQTLYGALPTTLAKLGLFDISGAKEAALNGLSAKVRTFTGYKSLVVNAKTLELSGKNFSWDDPNLGPQIYNMAYYSMPHDLALEHTAKVMLAPDLATKQLMYGNLVKETVKNAGLSADNSIFEKVMSQAQRSTDGGELSNIAYGHDVSGAPRGYVDMQDGGKRGVALWGYQRGSNAFIDFKELRQAIRQSTIHGLLYQKADDGFTFYTDKVFAPLTLFSAAFGLRVASSEALHQIIRAGLGDYLQSQVAQSASKYNLLGKLSENEIQRFADSAAQALTSEDHNALLTGNKVFDNSVTKLIKNKVDIYKSLNPTERANEIATDMRDLKNRISPVGFVNSKVAPYLAADKLDTVTKYQQLMGSGKGLPAGVASDHGKIFKNNAEDRVDLLAQLTGHTSKPTEEIASLTGTNPHFHQFWALNLSKLRNEEMARDIAKDYQSLSKQSGFANLSNDDKWSQVRSLFESRVKDVNQYADLRPSMVGLSKGDPASYSNEVVSSFRGLVEGVNGTIHDNLINNIKNGERTYENQLKGIPATDSPFAMLGKSYKPNWGNPLEKVMDLGYRTFINPIIDHVSREPIFAHYLHQNFMDMKPLIDKGLSEDEALRLAGQKATLDMIPLIHNPALRSQWATMSRSLFPFYFAQEQAMKRIARNGLLDGRAITAFRSYQMIQQGMSNPTFVHTDSTGKKYVVYPMVGEFGNSLVRGLQSMGANLFTGMPESVTGNPASLATVVPELKIPGTSPIGHVALDEISKIFPDSSKIINKLSGGFGGRSWIDTWLPNTLIKDAYLALTMDQKQNVVHNALMSSLASGAFHGLVSPDYAKLPAPQQQAILDKLENNAKTNLLLQGFFSFFLPLAPTVNNMDYTKNLQSFRSEYQQMVAPKTNGGQGLTIAEAQDKFTSEHGSQAISYTVGWSKTKDEGATIPLSDTTIKFLADNKDIINNPKYAAGAAFLIPQNTSGGDIQGIENKLLTMHLREKQNPTDFMNSVYVAKGWSDIGPDFKAYQDAVTEAKSTNNSKALGIISQAWTAYTDEFRKSNPIWWASYKDPSKVTTAQNSLDGLIQLQKDGKLGTSPQAAGISGLLTDYNDFHSALLTQTKGTKYTATGYKIIDAWNIYLDQTMTNEVGLTSVINAVFRKAYQK